MFAACLALLGCTEAKSGHGPDPDDESNMRFPPLRDAGGPEDAGPPGTLSGSSSNDASTSGGGGATQRDSSVPSFTEIYLAVLQQRCAPCHTGTGDAATGISLGQLDMSTQAKAHANLVNVIAQGSECKTPWNYVRIVPGDPAKSVMFQKISPELQSCGKKMPMDRAPLSRAELVLISDWIAAGAKDD